jgi:hypothetical protein
MISLSDGTTTLTLNPDLYWADEFARGQVQQTKELSLTGAAIIQSAALTNGLPITLQPPDDASAWTPRAGIEQLRNWAAVAGQELTLTLRSTARQVVFRHEDSNGPLSVTPIRYLRDTDNADEFYLCTIRFTEI